MSKLEASGGATLPAEVVGQEASGARRWIPWVVSLVVVSWVLWPYRTESGREVLLSAFTRASGWTFVVAVFGTLAIWLSDSFATARTFRRWGTRLGLGETCLLRGATALFDVINPALGQAVLTMVVYRRGTPLAQTFAVVLLMNMIFLVQIALVSGLGLLIGGAPQSPIVPIAVGIALGMAALYVAALAIRPRALARNATVAWLMDAGLSGHAAAFLYRLPNVAVLITTQVLYMYCFGIDIPISVALFYLPAMMFIVGVPVSVQGLGPGQVAAVAFFAAYADGDRATAEATVLACAFAATALTTFCAALIGFFCMGTETGRSAINSVRGQWRRRPAETSAAESWS
ncbi:MAG: lysylphosphatidylglycerol synthase domain-containing protein [Myxococcales bacterium]|nr:lysylphosphatidylglycerol synthase domain-containing protein [Myxococcales bacterium]